jgi:hypothetical protein
MHLNYTLSWTSGTHRCLHRLRMGDELIERLAPALAEAHAVMRVAAVLVLVQGKTQFALTLPRGAATAGLSSHHASPPAGRGTIGEALGKPAGAPCEPRR